ncbi:MAG: hypothetical protein ABSF74_10640 [Dehalococcoidia bacterium]|jgi:hypothetical protein
MKNSDLISALIYTGISLLAAGIFIVATLSAKYSNVDRFGGAAWVFILSMIILMPVVIPIVKKR